MDCARAGALGTRPERGADRNPRWEIVCVGDDLITEFSSRTREIELKKDELIAEYVAKQGLMPSPKVLVELRAQATLETRPPKEIWSLVHLTAEWRGRAPLSSSGARPRSGHRLIRRVGLLLTADDVPLPAIEAIAADVVSAVGVKRSVWNHWNVMAEASKQTMDLRPATTADREVAVSMIIDAVQR